MRLPVDWISEYLSNDLTVRQLADTLTDTGLEVEAIAGAADAPVLDIRVMSNRGDCLSVLGIARELACALRRPLADPYRGQERAPCPVASGPPAASLARVLLDDPALCPRYSARILRNVTIAPSPAWAQRRLELCGLRPINNVVDATNLVMLEFGQPLHAFDYQLLRAAPGETIPTIIVRRARSGERLVTIDGEERALDPEVLLITDPSGPIALAGIMGGSSTEIHEGTTQVLLESAHFDPRTVRRGARSLGMTTEASYRFERAVDPGGTVRALDRACDLIAHFCANQVELAQGVVDAYPHPIKEVEIKLRPERANALLGTTLTAEEMAECLRWLQLEVRGKRVLTVRVPTFRQDLKQEVDLVEEVARSYGYQNLRETLPRASVGVGRLPADLGLERELRATLRGLGLSEAVTSSLESPATLARLRLPDDHPLARPVTISNAKTVDHSQLRTTLLTSLLDAAAHNRRHRLPDIGLFEIGRVYWARGADELPHQPQHLGIIGSGVIARARWASSRDAEQWDFYALKGIVESLLQTAARAPGDYAPADHPCLQFSRTAQVSIAGVVIGYLGEVAPGIREAWDLPDPVYFAELDLEQLVQHLPSTTRYQLVSRYPAVTRDVAFLVSTDIPAQRAASVIRQSAGEDLESLSLFDAYQGRPLPEGRRNLAYSLTFRTSDRTLTDQEVDAIMDRVRAALRDHLSALIRQ